VVLLTTSEFGRRPFENGSDGTDHGAAAPQFLFGSKVKGGIYGPNPSLTDFDNNANLLHEFDFRQLYATLMTQWFELGQQEIENILFHSFETFLDIDNRSNTLCNYSVAHIFLLKLLMRRQLSLKVLA
jgi:uncharacterized protein (DUF1501 family)